mmetsp:Transcript_49965/g.139988  ORF Transcript_49965/g.139988 Transcript_49965/m.139988 type:complete len:265 (-) Transcript_49965:887-1681(-)
MGWGLRPVEALEALHWDLFERPDLADEVLALLHLVLVFPAFSVKFLLLLLPHLLRVLSASCGGLGLGEARTLAVILRFENDLHVLHEFHFLVMPLLFQQLLHLLLVALGDDLLLPLAILGCLNGFLARELHFHHALPHSRFLFHCVLLALVLLPFVKTGGVVELCLIALEYLGLFSLLFPNECVFAQDGRYVLPDDGILLGRVVAILVQHIFRRRRLESALCHALGLDLFRQLLQFALCSPTFCPQVRHKRRIVLVLDSIPFLI